MGSPTRSIQAAFEASLNAFATANSIQLALSNVAYSRTTGTPYIKADFLPGQPSQANLGPAGKNRNTGIFQATLFYPEGVGMVTPGAKADALVDHFKRGIVLFQSGVSIHITRSYAGPAIIEPGWLYIPITVQYYCYSEN